MNDIHSTAIIEEGAKIGDENVIGPYTVIDKTVIIGDNNIFGAGCHLINNVMVGDNNKFGSHVVIGGNGEIKEESIFSGWVIIGDGNFINHHVSIDRPVKHTTEIGDNNYIMVKSHIAHDCIVEDDVIMSSGNILGGHTILLQGCNLGLGVVTHQYTTIGQYSMIGMNTTVSKDISPFMKVVGSPPKCIGLNEFKLDILDCSGYTEEVIDTILRSEMYGLFLIQSNRRGRVLEYEL